MVKRADGILKFHPIKEESPVQEAEIVGIYQVKEKIKPYMSGDTFRSENIIFSDLHFPEKVEQDDPLYEKAYFKAADVDDYEAVKDAIRKTDIDWPLRRYQTLRRTIWQDSRQSFRRKWMRGKSQRIIRRRN